MKIRISAAVLTFFFLNQAAFGAECLSDWPSTQKKLERLRAKAECNYSKNLDECRINSDILSPEQRYASSALGGSVARAMTYTRTLCAGQAMAQNNLSPSDIWATFLFPEAFASGCYRPYQTYVKEAKFVSDEAVRAVENLQRDRLLEIWAKRNRLSESQAQELINSYSTTANTFDAYKTTDGKTYFRRGNEIRQFKNPLGSATPTQAEFELMTILRSRDFGALSNSWKDAVFNSLESSKKDMLKTIDTMKSGYMFEVNQAHNAGKITDLLGDLSKKMKSNFAGKLTPEISDSIAAVENVAAAGNFKLVCVAVEQFAPSPLLMRIIFPLAYAGKICPLDSVARAAANETADAGLAAVTEEAAAKTAAKRLLMRGAIRGANWMGLAMTAGELGFMGYNKLDPCPSGNRFMAGRKREHGCQGEMTADTLANPLAYMDEVGKNLSTPYQRTSFFNLPEADQKKELTSAEFCQKFSDLYDKSYGGKSISCEPNGSVVVRDKISHIDHQLIFDGEKNISKVATFGSGAAYGASIVNLDKDEMVTSIDMYDQTRANPLVAESAAQSFSIKEAVAHGSSKSDNARSSLNDVSLDMSVMLEASACCEGSLGTDDPLGRCQNMRKSSRSTTMAIDPAEAKSAAGRK